MNHHLLVINTFFCFSARVFETTEIITITLAAYGPVGTYDFGTRACIDCWFNAIVCQWPGDPRFVHVLDPQHIMTTA